MSSAQGSGTAAEQCTACGRARAEVKVIFRAKTDERITICNRCIDECAVAIADAPTRIPGRAHACAYCAKMDDQVAVIVGIGTQKICDECIDTYRAALTT